MSFCHSIGELTWRPHNVNVDANLNSVLISDPPLTALDNTGVSSVPKKDSELAAIQIMPVDSETHMKQDAIKAVETLTNDFEVLDTSESEWTYYSDGSKYGKRCLFDGQFMGNKTTSDEIQLELMIGTRFKPPDPRGGLPSIAPGDKSYSVPEFSSEFHAEGSTLPAVNFSRTTECVAETFIPLQQLWSSPSASYTEKEKDRMLHQEIDEVKALDKWSPAKPMAAGF